MFLNFVFVFVYVAWILSILFSSQIKKGELTILTTKHSLLATTWKVCFFWQQIMATMNYNLQMQLQSKSNNDKKSGDKEIIIYIFYFLQFYSSSLPWLLESWMQNSIIVCLKHSFMIVHHALGTDTEEFHVAMQLFSDRSQMASICDQKFSSTQAQNVRSVGCDRRFWSFFFLNSLLAQIP